MVLHLPTASRWVLVFALLVMGLVSSGFGDAASDRFSADISGRKTFTLRYGIGDSQGLGQAPYQLVLDQTLAVDVTATALSVLTLDAHFNDQEPPSMQTITLHLNADPLTGVLGDFSLSGKEAFAVYNKKLKGIRLDYKLPGSGTATAILSQIEGISESKTFVGHSAHGEITFSFSPPDRPWETQPYPRNLDGLFHYKLSAPYIEGFSEVDLEFSPSSGLKELLTNYGLGYLYKTISESPREELKQGAFAVVADESDYLVLLRHPHDLLRARISDYIKAYNQENGLTGKEKETYPLNPGTDYERAFLDALSAHVNITVDGTNYPLTSGGRRKFYYLGEKGVKDVEVEVSVDGATFRPITDPDLASAYSVTPFPEEGILEVDFPPEFYAGKRSAMRVSFSYSVSGNAYPLGLSIVPGSEKVYLNGKLLTRDTDYTIDYEVGMLILLVDVKDSDTIKIDYERARGGLGSSAEYSRDFYGVSLQLPVSDSLSLEGSLLQAADHPTPLTDPDRARTMPNTHTVSGLVGRVDLDGFSADFTLGWSDDRFPFDDNARVNLPNAVAAIATVEGYAFFAHAAGVSVYHDGDWDLYTAADGLSANRVYDVRGVEGRVFFATAGGLTVLDLSGDSPLARVENWHRYSTDAGLPNSAVHSLAVADGTLWIGTEGGIAAVPLDSLDEPESWKIYVSQEILDLGPIRAIGASSAGTVYLGTDHGLFAFDPETGELSPMSGMSGVRVNRIIVRDGTVYAAGDLGLRGFKDGVGTGWIVFGTPVYSVAIVNGTLWYGDEAGLHSLTGDTPYTGGAVTAVSSDGEGGVWAGTRAGEGYVLEVVHAAGGTVARYPTAVTRIDGRDPGRFRDIPAADHTARGGIVRADFNRALGPFTLTGAFETVSPEFTAIGRLGREDRTGWSLELDGDPADGLSLSAAHSYYLLDLSSDHPKRTLDNSVSLSWEFGPTLSLGARHRLVDDDPDAAGFDSGKFSYQIDLSEKLFSDALSLSLGWNDGFTWDGDTTRRDTRLTANGTAKPLPGLTLAVTFSRPVGFSPERRSERESLSGSVDWSGKVVLGTVSFSYKVGLDRGAGPFRVTHDGKLTTRVAKLKLGGLSALPVLTATFSEKDGVITLGGGGSLTLGYSGMSTTVNYNHELSGLGLEREQTSDRITLRLSYSGIKDLRPSITYTWNRSAVIYKGITKASLNQSLIGKLSYRPTGGWSDELSFSVRGSSGKGRTSLTGNLTNTLLYPIADALSARLVLDGRYSGEGRLDGSLRGGVDWTISATWSSSLSATYTAGLKPGGGMYNGLLFELTVAATF